MEKNMTTEQKSPSQHTPRPWLQEDPEESGNILITDEQGVSVATCWKQPLDPPDWVEANGRLIAATPELLETLDFVRGWFMKNDLDDDESWAIFEEICAAIAKARGQA
jgi:hypothetical protein